jgi:hypothetical protein
MAQRPADMYSIYNDGTTISLGIYYMCMPRNDNLSPPPQPLGEDVRRPKERPVERIIGQGCLVTEVSGEVSYIGLKCHLTHLMSNTLQKNPLLLHFAYLSILARSDKPTVYCMPEVKQHRIIVKLIWH